MNIVCFFVNWCKYCQMVVEFDCMLNCELIDFGIVCLEIQCVVCVVVC